MVSSMTGYGRARQLVRNHEITVEIKSVNHRYFDFTARVPKLYGYLEEVIKSSVRSRVSRGKIEVAVLIQTENGQSSEVSINAELAASYLQAMRDMGQQLQLTDDISLSNMSRFSDIFTVKKIEEDEEQMISDVLGVLNEALDLFCEARIAEGKKLAEDICQNLDFIEECVAFVETRSPQTVSEYTARLYSRLQELLQDQNIDQQRILTEAAIFADKTAVAEETVRLRSHLGQVREMLSGKGPVGRKLDFIVQEINREANTTGSKCQDLQITRKVVDMKSAVERIREQIQNLE